MTTVDLIVAEVVAVVPIAADREEVAIAGPTEVVEVRMAKVEMAIADPIEVVKVAGPTVSVEVRVVVVVVQAAGPIVSEAALIAVPTEVEEMKVVDPTGRSCLLPFYVKRNKRILKIRSLIKSQNVVSSNVAEVVIWL